MLNGTIAVFEKINPEFSGFLKTMEEMKHFDLESKPGKAPYGYNYPLYETGAPFIFMNAVGSQGDLSTMIHEGGHAVHSFLTHGLELTAFKKAFHLKLPSLPQCPWNYFLWNIGMNSMIKQMI